MFTSISLILAALCLLPAVPKLTGQPRMRASASRFGIAWQRYRLIGVAELTAAAGVMAGLVWRPLGVGAALCFAVLLLGAVFTHVRAGDSARELAPALIVFTVDVVYLVVAGTALR
jgi:hypothetical protein